MNVALPSIQDDLGFSHPQRDDVSPAQLERKVEESGVPDPPNTVNTLRFVMNHYLGTTYPMLPSESYAEGDLPYDFIPVVVK